MYCYLYIPTKFENF
nr:unnamed protein product [Callosobruchus analis]